LNIALALYSIALVMQALAALISMMLFKHSATAYRWAWLYLAIGLTLMLGRRLVPIQNLLETGHFNLVDAILSVPISGFLLIGVLGLKKLLLRADNAQIMMENLAQHDPLTNCLSRTEILYRISEEINRSLRNAHPFALLEIDIDRFKNVNDQYGHQIGDEVLKGLIRHSKEILRSIDSIGRIGGEEFLILLPETELNGAIQFAERLRSHIANTTMETNQVAPISITISIGTTVFDPKHQSEVNRLEVLSDLVKQADIAMYQAKNEGRNRVCRWDKSQSNQHLALKTG
jgi:diguanylate cyclase (GGDEF)-like protein